MSQDLPRDHDLGRPPCGGVAIAGDGQVSLGQTVVKHRGSKIRRLGAGPSSPGSREGRPTRLPSSHKFESKLEQHRGNSSGRRWSSPRTGGPTARCAAWKRCCWWRIASDLPPLRAGDLIKPDDGIAGSGQRLPYALAAARALVRHASLDARPWPRGHEDRREIDLYTNDAITVEEV